MFLRLLLVLLVPTEMDMMSDASWFLLGDAEILRDF
jgi:hypothetical protein